MVCPNCTTKSVIKLAYYTGGNKSSYRQVISQTFFLMSLPSQKNSEINSISLENADIELFESGKKWAWHQSGIGHAHYILKGQLLLKFIWSLPWQSCFYFQNCWSFLPYKAETDFRAKLVFIAPFKATDCQNNTNYWFSIEDL